MKRILLVEDDLSLINGLSFAVKKHGYLLDVAHTIDETDRLWQNGKYDLVILDVSLPDGSGFDICKSILRIGPFQAMVFFKEWSIMSFSMRSSREHISLEDKISLETAASSTSSFSHWMQISSIEEACSIVGNVPLATLGGFVVRS